MLQMYWSVETGLYALENAKGFLVQSSSIFNIENYINW